MARITLEELYRGEGGGAKYGAGGIMSAVMKDILSHGIPSDYDRQTWLEMLLIKHTLLAAKQTNGNRGRLRFGSLRIAAAFLLSIKEHIYCLKCQKTF
jgi:hypothetical protein